MKLSKFDDILKKLICLECDSGVDFNRINQNTGIFICQKCHTIYLNQGGIITALPQKYLDQEKYLNFFWQNKAFFEKNKTLKSYYEQFLDHLPEKTKTWEDDDVVFWDQKYAHDCLELQTKKLVSRAYLQDKILFQPLRDSGLKNHSILEVGCGEAIAAQKLLLPYGNDFLYIATDYSYQGLKFLKKKLQHKKNILYIQCLGDAIPFKNEVFDDIICLGVIHHMPKKEKHVLDLLKKLKPGGLLLINEPYNREYRLPKIVEHLIQKIIEPKQSAHEERINIKKFRKNFEKGGKILNEFHGHTPVKTVLIRITGTLYKRSVGFVKVVLITDKITEKTLGRVWKLFSTGDCLLLFKKHK